MKVALIGSNGFLGDHIGMLCAERGDQLAVWGRRAPVRHPFNRFVPTDLLHDNLDLDDIKNHDAIFYVAGAGIQSNLRQGWQMVFEMNTMLLVRLTKGLAESGFNGTLVSFGSYAEIGANTAEHLFTEEEVAASELNVPSDYCISKRMFTRFIRSNTPPFRHLHLILTTIYGPGENPQRLIPYTLSMIAQGEKPRFTAGSQVRQYTFVGDAAQAALALVDAKETGMFNIPGTERFTVREVVQQLYEFKGESMPEGIFGTDQRQDTAMQNLQLDGSRLHRALQNQAVPTTLRELIPKYETHE